MLYYIGRILLTPLVYLLFWPKVTGKENLPKEGSTIILPIIPQVLILLY